MHYNIIQLHFSTIYCSNTYFSYRTVGLYMFLSAPRMCVRQTLTLAPPLFLPIIPNGCCLPPSPFPSVVPTAAATAISLIPPLPPLERLVGSHGRERQLKTNSTLERKPQWSLYWNLEFGKPRNARNVLSTPKQTNWLPVRFLFGNCSWVCISLLTCTWPWSIIWGNMNSV